MRKGIVAIVASVLLLAGLPAFGHVSVTPREMPKGATATLAFAVPNEEPDHATVSVEVFWPDDVAFATITPEAKAGWTATPGATSIKWSGGSIAGESTESFAVALGPMPNRDTIVFKVVQTYDNGVVVRWIDERPGASGPDRPAVRVRLTGDPAPTVTTAAGAPPSTSPPTTLPDNDQADEKEDDDSNVMPIVFGALVLAGVGIGIAIGARRRVGGSPR